MHVGNGNNPLRIFEFLSSPHLVQPCLDSPITSKIRFFAHSQGCDSCEAPSLELTNKLFLGDNLQVLCYLLNQGFSEAFQMIYIDPPFYSDKEYYISKRIRRKNKKEIRIQQVTYKDIWGSLQDYLQFLYPRLVLIKQLLKRDGTLFVHLDWHVSHYVKILLDHIMGYENFRNEIIWCYTGPNRSKQDFPKKHDVILRYSKSKRIKFHPIYVPYRSGIHDTRGTAMKYQGKEVDFSEMESRGKQLEDWWIDVWAAERYRSDFSYYGTEKPRKLLERLILSSTDPGDLVGDFFAGSGTTLLVANKMGRKWIGVDNSLHAINLIRAKLISSIKQNDKLKGQKEFFDEYISFAKNHRLMRQDIDLREEYQKWKHITDDSKKKCSQETACASIIFNFVNLATHIRNHLQENNKEQSTRIVIAYPVELIKNLDVFKIIPQTLKELVNKRQIFFWEQPPAIIKLNPEESYELRISNYIHQNTYIDAFFVDRGLRNSERIDQILLSKFSEEENSIQPILHWTRLPHQESDESTVFKLHTIGKYQDPLDSNSSKYVIEIIDVLGLSSFYFLPMNSMA